MKLDFSHLVVTFYQDTIQNKAKSAEHGRPIFEDIEMVKIQVAGDPKSVLHAPAHDGSSVRDRETNQRLTYAQLHEGPYEAFKKNIDFIGSGTPLEELTFLTKSKVKELKALSVHTAEALAGLDGTNLGRLGMGARELKDQAQAWLNSASGSAEFTKLAGENAALKTQMDALMAQMAELNGKAQAPTTADQTGKGSSPFDAWSDEDIINWIVDAGGEKPHHRAGHDTIVAKADELNAKLEKAA